MPRYVHPLVAFTALLVLSLTGCGSETVVIATDGDYHPFNFVNDSGEIDGLGMGIRTDSGLREKFNDGISSMKEDGSLNDLLRKWIGEDTDTF